MMVHVLSGQWPFPSEANRVNPQNPNDPNDLVGVTEFDRREEYINKIGNEHPLMILIQHCLSNSPSHRPTSSEIHQRVSAVAAEYPSPFANRVEMLERIKAIGEEKETVRMEKDGALAEKDLQMSQLMTDKDVAVRDRERVLAELEESQLKVDSLCQAHLIELEGLHIQISDLTADNEHLLTVLAVRGQEVKSLEEKCKSEQKHHQVQLEFKMSEISSKNDLISNKSSTIQSLHT